MPFHEHISTPSGAHIALWHLTEERDELAALLSPAEREWLLAKGLSPKRFCEQAATRLLFNRLTETRDRAIRYSAEGAPLLDDLSGYISISHTRQWVAVAYHPALPVGIDIERPSEQVTRIAPRVLSEAELTACPATVRRTWIHLCWSAKEALFKAIPESGIDFREQLHIVPAQPMREGCLSATESRTEAHREYTLWYRATDDYVIVCATPLQ